MTMKDARKQLKKDKRRKCKLPDSNEIPSRELEAAHPGYSETPSYQRELEATRPKYSEDDLGELLIACRSYLDERRKEIEGPLTVGVNIDTGDSYLLGYFTGMRAGLEMASDLVACYIEWADRKIYHPDDVHPRK